MVVPAGDITASRAGRIGRGAVRRVVPSHPISGSSSTTSTAFSSQTSYSSSGGTNLSVSADGEMRVHVVAGDSAGGYLAFMTALSIPAAGWPKPAGVVVISPATNIGPDRAVCGKTRGCAVFPPRAAGVFARYVARAQSRITVGGEPGPLASWVAEDRREIATGDDPCRCR